jgi:predicted RNase H-like HicB family nuclease
VNLYCGNCKAIQSFSGDPPKCDVCGCVSGTESTETTEETNRRWLKALREGWEQHLADFREKGLPEPEPEQLAKLEEELLASGLAERVMALKRVLRQRPQEKLRQQINVDAAMGNQGSILRVIKSSELDKK